MRNLGLLDLGFVLFESKDTPLHVSGLAVLEPPQQRRSDFARTLYSRLLTFTDVAAPFNWRLKLSLTGLPQWEEDADVDLDYHVRLAMLPQPGSQAQLLETVARLHSQALDRSRPLWEIWLIDGMQDGRVAICFKIHHALADGVRASALFNDSCDTCPDSGKMRPFWTLGLNKQDNADRSADNGLLKLLGETLNVASHQVGALPSLLKIGTKLALKAFKLGDADLKVPFTAPHTPFNRSPKRARTINLVKFPLTRVKRLSRLTGASLNDVLLSLCDTALNRYLDEQNWTQRKPLVALMPVNLRRNGDVLSACNKMSLGLVELGERHATPAERLNAIQRSTRGVKKEALSMSTTAYSQYSIMVNAVGLLEGKLRLNGYLPPASNLIISNVPGPEQALYFMGAKVVDTYPISLLIPGQTLNITLYSYDGYVHCGLVSCTQSLPEFEHMSAYMQQALDALEQDLMAIATVLVRQKMTSSDQDADTEVIDMEINAPSSEH